MSKTFPPLKVPKPAAGQNANTGSSGGETRAIVIDSNPLLLVTLPQRHSSCRGAGMFDNVPEQLGCTPIHHYSSFAVQSVVVADSGKRKRNDMFVGHLFA